MVEDSKPHTAKDHADNQPKSNFELGKEPGRPQAHFTPKRMWMNDPNGMIYMNGCHHLFYQFHPDSMIWGPMHWGHATSRDLLTWENHNISLYPDKHGTIFSGCCVIDKENTSKLFDSSGENNLVAVYSYDTQLQGLATSIDNGMTWVKFEGNPILPAIKKNFRDPKVIWHALTGNWVMAISAERECQFYTSKNLIDWTFASSFSAGCKEGIWEVPDLFELYDINGNPKWVLIISISKGSPAGGSGIQYFVGDFDGKNFHWEETIGTKWLDYGPDNYAGSTWFNEPDNDKLYIGWMSNWTYANNVPTDPWRGSMTLPRKLQLFDNGSGFEVGGFPKIWPTKNHAGLSLIEFNFQASEGLCQIINLEIDGKKTGHKLIVNFETLHFSLERPQAISSMYKTAVMPIVSKTSLHLKMIFDNGLIEVFDIKTGRSLSQLSFDFASSKKQSKL